MKFYFMLCCMLLCISASAQWRLQVQSGPAFSLRRADKDQIFYAEKSGKHAQLRGAYYWGHLGLGMAVGFQKFDVRDNIESLPGLPQIVDLSISGSGLQAVSFLAGPEFCFACGDKFKFNLGFRGGVTVVNKNAFVASDAARAVFSNAISSKAPFTFNTGIAAHYFFKPHLGLGLSADYQTFKVKALNAANTGGISSNRSLQSSVQVMNTGLSLTYKF